MTMHNSTLSFRISAGLKNIIGRDLISDKYIAIFELVKNAYDAGASKVNISFVNDSNGDGEIVISDNGCGMTYDDIVEKWLFVAYSEKKPKNRERSSFRDAIKRETAGAKGVGRFSCDRLGESLTLLTRTGSEGITNKVEVNWSEFELDDTKEFMNIPVRYSTVAEMPGGFRTGTTLIVNSLRENWKRDDLLRLRRSLMKLISPDANKGELPFDIELIVPAERETDKEVLGKFGINPERDIVNGTIHNDIFEKLNIKTTSIEVKISEDGQLISSHLSDRGEEIFSVVERNRDYYGLHDISIVVFYLNQSAKINFARQMGGVTSKDYGSVFIYKNGFRINPYGESGQDFFGIDQRKAQGWKRYLGTREIMGRISIKGNNDQFVETSSRAHGFIQTPAVDMLVKLFLEKVISVLEKYVVNLINWGEPLKSEPDHVIAPSEIGTQIIAQFINSVDPKDVVSVEYNQDILAGANAQGESDNISASLKKLKNVAERTQDSGLMNLARDLSRRTEAIVSQNMQLEAENAEKDKALAKEKEDRQAREKQLFFLKGAANQDVTNLVNGFHTVYTLTDAAKGSIDYLSELLSEIDFDKKDFVLSIVGQIMQANEKARKLADLAIHGNQSLKQKGLGSIYDFLNQYIQEGMAVKGLKYELAQDDRAFACKFDTASIGIILDNVASNSIKAGATTLQIILSESGNYVEVAFVDNGLGLAENVPPESLFEWGFSSNRQKKGSGIGLYHVRQLVEEMKGTVEVDTAYKQGFKLIVRLRK